MGTGSRVCGYVLVVAIAVSGVHGIAAAGVNEDTVAFVNGDKINGLELRESLGIWAGVMSASGVPQETKKAALDRLIDRRLIEQAARWKKLDKMDEFSRRSMESREKLLVPVLMRDEIASRLKIEHEEVRAESARLRKENKNLPKDQAMEAAKKTIWQRELRKIEQELVAAAREEASISIDEETIARIGKGESVEDNAVLGTAASAAVNYGELKDLVRKMRGGRHAGDLGANPRMLRDLVDRELTGRALLAYARNRKVEESERMKAARREADRAILIDLFMEREILKGVKVTEKEITETYARHSQMLVRDGKKIPLSEVKEDIRRIALEGKSKAAMMEYLARLKKKAKIKINDKLLPKV